MFPLSFRLIGSVLIDRYSKSFQVVVLGLGFLLKGCMPSTPEGIKPVAGFDINQYLGCWYEIARLDSRVLTTRPRAFTLSAVSALVYEDLARLPPSTGRQNNNLPLLSARAAS